MSHCICHGINSDIRFLEMSRRIAVEELLRFGDFWWRYSCSYEGINDDICGGRLLGSLITFLGSFQRLIFGLEGRIRPNIYGLSKCSWVKNA